MKTITIQKGDDTGAFGIRRLRIRIDSGCLSEGMTASFSLLSFTKDFSAAEVATGELDIELSGTITATFPLGTYFGALRLFDGDSRLLTVTGRIPFTIVPAGSLDRISGDGVTVQTLSMATDLVTIRVGFAVDYQDVEGKPSINGVSVDGDRTGADYGLASASSVTAESERAQAREGELSVTLASTGLALSAEVDRATAKESALETTDGALAAAISNEAARAKSREDAIEAAVPGVAAAAVASETTRARAAESAVSASVAAEKSRAEAAEATVSAAVAAERTRAEAKETDLAQSDAANASAISAEAARAKAAESANAAAVEAEKTRALAQEAAIRQEIAASGDRRIRVLNALPEIGETGIIYLIPSAIQTAGNVRDEYLWIDGHWELVGGHGGGGGTVTWDGIEGKPEWIGDEKPGYTADEVGAYPAVRDGVSGSPYQSDEELVVNNSLSANSVASSTAVSSKTLSVGTESTATGGTEGGAAAVGRHVRSLAENSMAGGHRSMTASGSKYAFAFGNRSYAPTGAVALGYQAWAASAGQFANDDTDVITGLGSKHKYSFVWQGKGSAEVGYYHSHGDGSFNINPVLGAQSVYIGESKLTDIIVSYSAKAYKADSFLSKYEYNDSEWISYRLFIDTEPADVSLNNIILTDYTGKMYDVTGVTVGEDSLRISGTDIPECLQGDIPFSGFYECAVSITGVSKSSATVTPACRAALENHAATQIETSGTALNEAVKAAAGGDSMTQVSDGVYAYTGTYVDAESTAY